MKKNVPGNSNNNSFCRNPLHSQTTSSNKTSRHTTTIDEETVTKLDDTETMKNNSVASVAIEEKSPVTGLSIKVIKTENPDNINNLWIPTKSVITHQYTNNYEPSEGNLRETVPYESNNGKVRYDRVMSELQAHMAQDRSVLANHNNYEHSVKSLYRKSKAMGQTAGSQEESMVSFTLREIGPLHLAGYGDINSQDTPYNRYQTNLRAYEKHQIVISYNQRKRKLKPTRQRVSHQNHAVQYRQNRNSYLNKMKSFNYFGESSTKDETSGESDDGSSIF
ncbi:hypothetical protein WDU94_005204 [Cyamophila willieti]